MLRKLILAGAMLCVAWSANAQNQVKPGNLSTTNKSVVITTGNTFQTVVTVDVANPRNSLTIQNNNATDACWLTFGSFGGTTITAANATKGRSIQLAAGAAFTRYIPYIPSDEIEATCATSSDTLYIDLQ